MEGDESFPTFASRSDPPNAKCFYTGKKKNCKMLVHLRVLPTFNHGSLKDACRTVRHYKCGFLVAPNKRLIKFHPIRIAYSRPKISLRLNIFCQEGLP